MKKFITGAVLRRKDVKEKYLTNKDLNDYLSIYETKFGLVATIKPIKDFFPFVKPKKGKETKIDFDKQVDTSNWVKPDTESIKRELIKNLFLEEIYKKDTEEWNRANAVSDSLYGILHSTSPKNPQIIMHYARLGNHIETALNLYKNPEKKTYFGKTTKEYLLNDKRTFKERKKDIKIWEEKFLNKIIKVRK